MTTRRNFLKTGSIFLAGPLIGEKVYSAVSTPDNKKSFSTIVPKMIDDYASKHPAPKARKSTSKVVEEQLKASKTCVKDPKLTWMFENCYPNTLDVICEFEMVDGKPDTFMITGDIHAMWLRDSPAQVYPFVTLAEKNKSLRQMLVGTINRQTACILIDLYASGLDEGPTGSEWKSDRMEMKKELHGRKWEIDPFCYPIRLAYHYWEKIGDTPVFDSKWEQAMETICRTFYKQQCRGSLGPYRFFHMTDRQDGILLNDGWGNPVNPVGLAISSFRPPDDTTLFDFSIPSNLFAITSLRQVAEILHVVGNSTDLAGRREASTGEVGETVKKYAIVEHPELDKTYASGMDGYGGQAFMDDTNVPNLLALPFLGCVGMNGLVYQNTRRLALSPSSPYFSKGKAGGGIDDPHIGFSYIRPVSLIMCATTSNDRKEIRYCVETLRDTDRGTDFAHESFHKGGPSGYTHLWFAWTNILFDESIVKLQSEDKLKDLLD